MKLNSSNQEWNYEEQVIAHNKDNAKINNVDGKSEISATTNSINNDFENFINSPMKNRGNMQEILNKTVDTESNKQVIENILKVF